MDERLKILLQLAAVLAVGSLLAFRPQSVDVTRDYIHFQEAYQADEYQEMALTMADLAQRLTWRPELWEKAGHFAQRAEELALAEAYFERARALDVLTQQGRIALGEVYHAQGEVSLAEEVWSEVEGSPQTAGYLAQLHQELGDYPAAIRDWREYISLVDEVDPGTHFKLGLLLAAEEPVRALPHLEKAAPSYPEAEKLRSALTETQDQEPAYQQVVAGQALASLDRWTLAEYAFEKAVRYRPDYPQAWAYWGEALQQVGKGDPDPLQALEKAYDLAPESPEVNIFLGIYWQRKDEHSRALPFFETAADIWPDNPEVYVEQGQSLAVLGDLSTALAMYEKAVQKDPENPAYRRLLAAFCVTYHYKVQEKGLPAARQAVHLSGGDPPALLVMGQVLREVGDLQNAKKFFIQALEKDPKFARAHFSLGMTYLALDKKALADRHLQAVLYYSTNPTLREQAQRALATFSP
ncbi:MAG: tetratricopeptide repeat protein [Chloroflexota bacterium]